MQGKKVINLEKIENYNKHVKPIYILVRVKWFNEKYHVSEGWNVTTRIRSKILKSFVSITKMVRGGESYLLVDVDVPPLIVKMRELKIRLKAWINKYKI